VWESGRAHPERTVSQANGIDLPLTADRGYPGRWETPSVCETFCKNRRAEPSSLNGTGTLETMVTFAATDIERTSVGLARTGIHIRNTLPSLVGARLRTPRSTLDLANPSVLDLVRVRLIDSPECRVIAVSCQVKLAK
jgi:hypothetical protein